MILYLYALADRVERLDGLAGVGDEPLVQIETANARLVAGWIAAPPAIDRGTLEAQDRVIRALHDRAAALLPMRFGTAVDGVDAAVRAVSIVARTLPDRFDLVRGREQMTVRVLRTAGLPSRPAAASARSRRSSPGITGRAEADAAGTSYLRARAIRDVPPEIAPLVEGTRTIARATRVERGSSDLLATVYQLVERGHGAEYRGQVERIAATLPHLTLRVSGPSPVFAFARD